MPPRLAPHLVALFALLLTLLVSNTAHAWVETELLSAESRVELRRDGGAHVQHKLTFRIRGGPLRALDLSISDRNIGVSGDANLTTSGDAMTAKMPIPVAIEQRPDGDLRIEIDEKRGVRRGVYDLDFGYDVDLLLAGGLTRDGSMLRMTWMGPKWQDGIDNVKCIIAVPASPTAPRPAYDTHADANNETGSGSVGSYLTTITRLPEFDEVTLIRPHVARGESVPWSVRLDPAAVGEVNDPRLHAPSAAVAAPPIPPARRAVLLGASALIAIAYSIVVALKHRQVLAGCTDRGVSPRPLAPFGIVARVALAGPLLGIGLAAQAWLQDPTPGSLAVLAVVALTVYRTPLAPSAPRGPGRWLPLTDEDAFRTTPVTAATWLDVSTLSGKIVWTLATVAFATAVVLVSRLSVYHAHVAALDYVVLAGLFWTGRRTQLPADAVRSSGPLLGQLAETLRKSTSLGTPRVRAIGRVPTGAACPDEVRLVLEPRISVRGFHAIEIGIAWAHGSSGPTPFFQALLRVVDGSPCHEAVTARLRKARWLRGRESYERVLTLAPTLPTAEHTVRLVESMVNAIREPAPVQTESVASARKARAQARPSAPKSARKAAGTSSRTSNAGTDALPLHTTW